MTRCAHCDEPIYEGTYAQRERGPVVPDDQLIAGDKLWRHTNSGLAFCLDSILRVATPKEDS